MLFALHTQSVQVFMVVGWPPTCLLKEKCRLRLFLTVHIILPPLSLSLFTHTDRVVDELQPERHFTADEIITLMRPLASLPPPQNMALDAVHFTFDQVLFILCQHFGPLLTKVCFPTVRQFCQCYIANLMVMRAKYRNVTKYGLNIGKNAGLGNSFLI